MTKKDRRKKLFANKMHMELFFLFFLAAFLPVLIVTICVYYLIFNIAANQIGIPEAIAYNIIPASKKVIYVLLSATPFSIFILLLLAYNATYSMVGPFNRIVRELDGLIESGKKGKILIREKDKFYPLVKRINKLLERSGRD